MAQFPSKNAILELESKKIERAQTARFFVCSPTTMRTPPPDATTYPELGALRQKITELVAQNAVAMVQQAIDAVREEGQYQAIKYLFEMIGLYPAVGQEESPGQESLAQILLEQLGLSDLHDSHKGNRNQQKPYLRHPLE